MSRKLIPAVVNQACSALPDSASGKPEANPNRPMLRMRQLRPGNAATSSVDIVDHVRRVIRKPRRGRDRAGLELRAQAWRDDLVIDAPAHVVRARRAARGPPGVILALGFQRAIAVHPTLFLYQPVEPGAL